MPPVAADLAKLRAAFGLTPEAVAAAALEAAAAKGIGRQPRTITAATTADERVETIPTPTLPIAHTERGADGEIRVEDSDVSTPEHGRTLQPAPGSVDVVTSTFSLANGCQVTKHTSSGNTITSVMQTRCPTGGGSTGVTTAFKIKCVKTTPPHALPLRARSGPRSRRRCVCCVSRIFSCRGSARFHSTMPCPTPCDSRAKSTRRKPTRASQLTSRSATQRASYSST